MWIALIAGSFKPFTSGHFKLVKAAAQECDQVHLFVSVKDRVRPGEFPIEWSKMKVVWEKFIIPLALPNNVEVHFSNNPTSDQFSMLQEAEKNPFEYNTYLIYADENDIKRYDNTRIREKTLASLFANNQLTFKAIPRNDVSGTSARKALAEGDMINFIFLMPEPLQQYGHGIYKTLKEKEEI